MRQRFETPEQREAEEQVAQWFVSTYMPGHVFERLPDRDVLDFAITQADDIKAFLEVKCRPGVLAYPSYRVELNKLERARRWRAIAPTFLAIRDGDKVACCRFSTIATNRFLMFGRGRSRDGQDRAVSAEFDWSAFKIVDMGKIAA